MTRPRAGCSAIWPTARKASSGPRTTVVSWPWWSARCTRTCGPGGSTSTTTSASPTHPCTCDNRDSKTIRAGRLLGRHGWRLARGSQPVQGDGDQLAYRGFGWQAGRRGEGVQGVAGQFLGHDVVPDVTGWRGVGQQAADEVAQVPLDAAEVLVPVHECGEFGALGPLVGDECVGLQDGFQ